jgi:hypothetical protein
VLGDEPSDNGNLKAGSDGVDATPARSKRLTPEFALRFVDGMIADSKSFQNL